MMDLSTILVRLFLIALLSGVVGLERHMAQRPAGIRTNILVGLGACVVMMLSIDLAAKTGAINLGALAGQVLTGIGFIGAGVIFRDREGSIEGITTAATIFAVAAIGLAVGAGLYTLATVATMLVLFALVVIGTFEHRHRPHA